MNRRTFIAGLLRNSLGGIPACLWTQSGARPVRAEVLPDVPKGRIAGDFLGLGYEASSVSERGLLTAANREYVQFVRTLAPSGVIRIGGNTSDYASWSPQGPAVSSPMETVIDRRRLRGLASFLRATGWKLIWGLNLGGGTLDQAVAEAVAVADCAGRSLLAFEIGNEPDLFAGIHRPADYSYSDYLAEYTRFKQAIREALPGAPFAGPDVFAHTEWFEAFAQAEAADLALLTHHYYAEGPPEDPATTIENLLLPNAALSRLLGSLQLASEEAAVPYRLCEVNSCFGGGKPGVSDTMASALWGLDFLFRLALSQAAGVNIETGVNQLGFLSWYTPIGIDSEGRYDARPLYYGLLAFGLAGRGDLVGLNLDGGGLNLTAYAVRADNGAIWLTLVNKEAVSSAEVRAACPGIGVARGQRLSAPSLTSTSGVALGGSMVSSGGEWLPGPPEEIPVTSGELEVVVPAAAAILIEMR
jgi:hypothetical protein